MNWQFSAFPFVGAEIGTSSIDLAQLIGFLVKTETESSPEILFLNKKQDVGKCPENTQ
jgi:hypothetical protein